MRIKYLGDQVTKIESRHPCNMKTEPGVISGTVATRYGFVLVWQYDNSGNNNGYGGMQYINNGKKWFRQWRTTVLTEKQLATEANKFAREKFESEQR